MPLILTALAFAIPACIGPTMTGAEGARVLGGFAAAAVAMPPVSTGRTAPLTPALMAVAGMAAVSSRRSRSKRWAPRR